MNADEYVLYPNPQGAYPLTTTMYGARTTKVIRRNEFSAREYWRIHWEPQGGGAWEYKGKVYKDHPERLLVVPPYTPVRHIVNKPCVYHWFHVSYGQPYDSVSGSLFYVPLHGWFNDSLQCLKELPREGPKCTFLANSLALWVVSALPREIWPTTAIDSRIRGAMERIRRDPTDKSINNDELAASAGMSRNAFIRLFKQQLGIPPNAYLIRRRLDLACGLLSNSDESIDWIADKCGFGVRSYMTRLFKEKLGITPAAYRKVHLE